MSDYFPPKSWISWGTKSNHHDRSGFFELKLKQLDDYKIPHPNGHLFYSCWTHQDPQTLLWHAGVIIEVKERRKTRGYKTEERAICSLEKIIYTDIQKKIKNANVNMTTAIKQNDWILKSLSIKESKY